MSFVQSNATSFSHPSEVPALVKEQIQSRGWSPHWRNTLALERDAAEFHDVRDQWNRDLRYFHLKVRNLNPRKPAINCVAYLQRVARLSGEEDIPPTVELTWAGRGTIPTATILPGSFRDLDLGYIVRTAPDTFYVQSFATSTLYQYELRRPGEFILSYRVVAENFKSTVASLRLSLSTTLSNTRMGVAEPPPGVGR